MRRTYGGARRLLAIISAAAITATGLVATASPVAAALGQTIYPSTWAYTDSRAANTSFVNALGDAPVGAWLDDDGKRHKSRSYFTFDLTPVRDKNLISALFSAREASVNDCSRPRTLEVWETSAITARTSWAKPPAEKSKVGDIAGTICPAYPSLDITALARKYLAQGKLSLTLELRVPKGKEGDVGLGRWLDRDFLGLSVVGNTAPGTPRDVSLDGKTCLNSGALALSTVNPSVRAYVEDADANETGGNDPVYPSFAIWPVGQPQLRVEWDGGWAGYAPTWVWGSVPDGVLRHGGSYVFVVRSFDGHDWSHWSPECRFTVDTERPAAAPTVTSADYPQDGQWTHGGPGIAGDFTFGAGGVADVVGYYYGIDWNSEYVAAPAPGAAVTVSITPTRDGPQQLSVRSVDLAGNVSDTTDYEFLVRPTAPAIVDQHPDAWAGDPRTLIFEPHMDDVVSYTWWIEDQPEQTIPAGADGRASVTVTPPAEGLVVHVYSTTAGGLRSGTNWMPINPVNGPLVTSTDFPFDGTQGLPVGTPGVFTIAPRAHGIVAYVVQFNRYQVDERPPQTIPADSITPVSVSFTAEQAGLNSIHVYSVDAQGRESGEVGLAFYPASIAPTVTSSDYPYGIRSGGVGVPGDFTFQPAVPGVVAYLYTFGDEPELTVPAAPDGTATVTWTPTVYNGDYGGWVNLLVRSRSANGTLSDAAYYSLNVDGLAPTIAAPASFVTGEPVSLTFTAQLPGSTEFTYRINNGPDQTVPVGPDGKATVTVTSNTYWLSVDVRSRTATGLISGWGWTQIYAS